MGVLFAAEPILAGAPANASADYRPRTTPGQATILPDGATPARRANPAGDSKSRERSRRNAAPGEPELPAGAMFAAALAAENMPPRTEPHEERVRHIARATRQPPETGRLLPDREA